MDSSYNGSSVGGFGSDANSANNFRGSNNLQNSTSVQNPVSVQNSAGTQNPISAQGFNTMSRPIDGIRRPVVVTQKPNVPQTPVVPQPLVSDNKDDIVLSGTKEKKSRKGLVLIILLLVCAIVGGVIIYFALNYSNSGESVAIKSFNDLANYLENGIEDISEETEGENGNNDGNGDSYIYAVSIKDEDIDFIREYYAGVDERLDKFLSNVDGLLSEETINSYKNTIKILSNAIDYRTRESEYMEAYDDGEETAKEYYNKNIMCSPSSTGDLDMQCFQETKYYSGILGKYELYKKAECETSFDEISSLECIEKSNLDEHDKTTFNYLYQFTDNSFDEFSSESSLRAISEAIKLSNDDISGRLNEK